MTRRSHVVAFAFSTVFACRLAIGANGDAWKQLAEHHIAFAKGLAEVQVRYGADFEPLINDVVVRCQPIDYKLAGLVPLDARKVNLFCAELCMPWLEAWAAALEPCDQRHVPKWCDNSALAAKHLAFGPYFEALTAAVRDSTSALERYNIMAVMADRVTKKVLQDYPHHEIDGWVADALVVYLPSARPEDVLDVVRALSFNSFGSHSASAREVRSYIERSTNLTSEQRGELERLADIIASTMAGT